MPRIISLYSIGVPALILSACTTVVPGKADHLAAATLAAAYPECRTKQIELVELRLPMQGLIPSNNFQHLAQFSQHVTVSANIPTRLREFVVLYETPNRSSAMRIPAVPLAVPDQVKIFKAEQLLASANVLTGFVGTQSYRQLEAAKLRVGKHSFLLLIANGFLNQAMWMGVFAEDGRKIYLGSMPHGAYQFIENEDGISLIDEFGNGKRLMITP